MASKSPVLEKLIEQFCRLPGIGKKTGQRLAYFAVTAQDNFATDFANALLDAKQKLHYCSKCQNLTDLECCNICSDQSRDKTKICVVESPQDVEAFERIKEYNGLYHVLHGAISPLEGIGPEQLKIKELMMRLSNSEIEEVIIATNPTVDGEATAGYLSRYIKVLGIKVTRLAYGIPVGGDLEYADEVTLSRSLDGRREV